MTLQEEQALRDRLAALEQLAQQLGTALELSTHAVKLLQVQVAASAYVAAATAAHLKGQGLLDGDALADVIVAQIPGGAEAQPQCAKLIRDMLCGRRLPDPPPTPQLLLIQGGKPDTPGAA